MSADPIALFARWLEDAKDLPEPTAMCLATATPEGVPSARMVLLKGVDADGFVFYTNIESRKGQELLANPRAALCFHWQPLGRQVRVEGVVERVSDAEADAYFDTRARESRIGAWASQQSRPLSGKTELLKRVAEFTAKYMVGDIPRPPYWSGFRIIPHAIEFWQQGAFRLHERSVYRWTGRDWEIGKLYP